MTNRIDRTFRQLRQKGKAAFIGYLTAGDPHLLATRKLVEELSATGCDIVELGVPFTDPLADGVVNQRAAQRALASGTTLAKILRCVSQIRKRTQIPLILFSYFNPIHKMGIERFSRRAVAAGLDGVLILDLPLEEGADVRKVLKKHGIKMILLIAPTSSDKRIASIGKKADGFIYCVSRTGVTGVQSSILKDVRVLVQRIKRRSKVPVVVGFGVSKAQQVREIARMADGVVVGSAIVAQIERHARNPAPSVARFVKGLLKGIES